MRTRQIEGFCREKGYHHKDNSGDKKLIYFECVGAPHRAAKGPDAQHRPAERQSKHNIEQEACELQQIKQMKQDLEQLESTGASSSDQVRSQQEAMSFQTIDGPT